MSDGQGRSDVRAMPEIELIHLSIQVCDDDIKAASASSGMKTPGCSSTSPAVSTSSSFSPKRNRCRRDRYRRHILTAASFSPPERCSRLESSTRITRRST